MKNINFMCEAIFSNGEKKIRFTATENAARNFANNQFKKDENVTVNIYDANGDLFTTYHA